MKLAVGETVQLKSGGAPMTIVEDLSTGFGRRRYRLAAMSSGGLLQECEVMGDAVTVYIGAPTPSCKVEGHIPQRPFDYER